MGSKKKLAESKKPELNLRNVTEEDLDFARKKQSRILKMKKLRFGGKSPRFLFKKNNKGIFEHLGSHDDFILFF